MATPVPNGAKEIALNKPDLFNGDREKFKEFLQSVEVYMDVNHKVYRSNLIKIAFVLLFMNSRPAATWKYQFIDEKLKLPPPANPNNKLGDMLIACIDTGACNFSDLPLINITEIMSI